MENYKRIIIDDLIYSVPIGIAERIRRLRFEGSLNGDFTKYLDYCKDIQDKYKGKEISGIYSTSYK